MDKRSRTWAKGVLILYLAVLFELIILKSKPPGEFLDAFLASPIWHGLPRPFEQVNYEPFKTIKLYLDNYGLLSDRIVLGNILGNVLLFVPLGTLMRFAFSPRIRSIVLWIMGTLTSLILEVTQYVSGFGIADVDDVLLNAFGHLLGLLIGLMLIQRSDRDAEELPETPEPQHHREGRP